MDLSDSLAVSVSALDAQRHRLNVIASNLAMRNPPKPVPVARIAGVMSCFRQPRVRRPFRRRSRKCPKDRADMPWMGESRPGHRRSETRETYTTRVILMPTRRVRHDAERERHGRNGQYDRRVSSL